MISDISKTLIITDMDGTFLPSSKIISDTDKNSIKRFQDLGGKFTIATGRGVQATTQFFNELDFSFPIIMCNGAVIYDVKNNCELWSSALPVENTLEMANDIFEKFPETGGEIVRLDNIYVPRMNEHEINHMRIAGVSEFAEMPLSDTPVPWLKVLFANTPEQILEIDKYIQTKNWDSVDFVRSAHTFIEMLPKNITKGSALIQMKKMFNLDDYTIIAVGDYNNDIEMLRAADIAVVPSNAQPEVKEAADIVLEQSCEENAISAIIRLIFANLNLEV